MNINREDVVQAALIVEKWCKENKKGVICDCPFSIYDSCALFDDDVPAEWNLEEVLRNRGIKNGN